MVAAVIHHLPGMVRDPAKGFQHGLGVPMGCHHGHRLRPITTVTPSTTETETETDNLLGVGALRLLGETTWTRIFQRISETGWIDTSKTVAVEHVVALQLEAELMIAGGTEIDDRTAIEAHPRGMTNDYRVFRTACQTMGEIILSMVLTELLGTKAEESASGAAHGYLPGALLNTVTPCIMTTPSTDRLFSTPCSILLQPPFHQRYILSESTICEQPAKPISCLRPALKSSIRPAPN